MSYHQFYKQLNDRALATFPGLKDIDAPAWEHLVSPLELKLPKKIYVTVSEAIRALYSLSRKDSYRAQLAKIPGIEPKKTARS